PARPIGFPIPGSMHHTLQAVPKWLRWTPEVPGYALGPPASPYVHFPLYHAVCDCFDPASSTTPSLVFQKLPVPYSVRQGYPAGRSAPATCPPECSPDVHTVSGAIPMNLKETGSFPAVHGPFPKIHH